MQCWENHWVPWIQGCERFPICRKAGTAKESLDVLVRPIGHAQWTIELAQVSGLGVDVLIKAEFDSVEASI